METNRILEELKNQKPSFLQVAKRKGFVCPACGNGSGKDGDGIALDPTDPGGGHYKCFKCDLYEDVVGLYGLANGISEFKDQVAGAASYFGISQGEPSPARKPKPGPGPAKTQPRPAPPAPEPREQETDFADFFLAAHERIGETDYPQRRGLGPAVVNRFRLGYAPEWRSPKTPNAPTSPRLIIPTSRYSYLARDTRLALTEEQGRYSKQKAGTVRIFNERALGGQRPVIVVEGEIDALSVMEVGGEAIALGSVANRRKLLDLLKGRPPARPLIIALDNDGSGARAAQELEEGLRGLGLPFYRVNLAGAHKDPNDALLADREAFAAAVAAAERLEDEAREAARQEYLRTAASYHLKGFVDGINASVNTPYISTGFDKLDRVLDGGLYEGLYTFGAITSLGKTTFMTQVADSIAEAGQDVLMVSLEMGRTELMAKSISRQTLRLALAHNLELRNAKTTRGITTGKLYAGYSKEEKELINKAILAYEPYASRIFISEGLGDIGADQVRAMVETHVTHTGAPPVVFIDYLQILAPHNPRSSDKQNTDKAVLELKRLSRDYKIPVVAISSFNRQNYKTPVDLEAFKESGAVEYSSDVLMGLQLKGVENKESFNAAEAKKKDPREVELVILKNRNGRAGDKIPFKYYPLFNHFVEEEGEENYAHSTVYAPAGRARKTAKSAR
jgi:replicative DNA helicase